MFSHFYKNAKIYVYTYVYRYMYVDIFIACNVIITNTELQKTKGEERVMVSFLKYL